MGWRHPCLYLSISKCVATFQSRFDRIPLTYWVISCWQHVHKFRNDLLWLGNAKWLCVALTQVIQVKRRLRSLSHNHNNRMIFLCSWGRNLTHPYTEGGKRSITPDSQPRSGYNRIAIKKKITVTCVSMIAAFCNNRNNHKRCNNPRTKDVWTLSF